ncbi:hypothetical protein AAZV13_02G269000 [Glycine max]
MGKTGNQRQKQQTSIISHSTMQLNIPMEQMNRFNNTWVGKLRKLDIFDRLEEELMWEAGQEIRPIYIGDDMVLLVGLTDSQAEHMCKNEDENGMSLFHSLEKWSPGMQPGNRLVWLQCWGVPLHAWNIENISKIVAAVGEMVEVDEEVEEMQRIDRARVLIRTPRGPMIQHTITTMING